MRKVLTFLCVSLMLSGCATQKIIPLTSDFWFKQQKTIAVVGLPVPKAKQDFNGQEGLLDIVAGFLATTSQTPMNTCLEHLSTQPLKRLKDQIATRLFQQGFTVKEIDVAPVFKLLEPRDGFSHFDVKAEASRLGTDYVLILESPSWGVVRPYYGFIPLAAPQAYVNLRGELVDVHNNRLAWYYDEGSIRPVHGEWDQAPDYPNMVSAIGSVIDDAKHKLQRDLFRTATLPTKLARYSIEY